MRSPTGWALSIAALLSLLFVVPVGPDGRGMDPVYFVVPVIATVVAVAAVRRRRNKLPWTTLWLGAGLWFVADLAHAIPFTSSLGRAVPDLIYCLGYLGVGHGLITLSRQQRRDHELPSFLDALIVTIGLGVPLIALSLPADPGAIGHDLIERAYPLGDLFLIVLLLRRGHVRTRGGQVFPLLIASLLCWIIVDVGWIMFDQWDGSDLSARMLGASGLFCYLGMVAAGCSAPHHGPATANTSSVVGRRRLLPIAIGVLAPVTTLAVPGVLDRSNGQLIAVIGAQLITGVLILARFDALLRHARQQSIELEELARRDPLTSMANRRSWEHELARAADRSRDTGEALWIAIIDLDHFKAYNDAYGHQNGDALLQEAGRRWSRELAPTDVLARIGGEEFGVLICGTDAVGAQQRLRGMLQSTPRGQTCSAGLARWHPDTDPNAASAAADSALYEAKRSGRNRIHCAVESLDGGQPVDSELQPILFTQPVVRARTSDPVGVEVLSRFDDLRHPKTVFTVAHRNGYGDLLEARVLRAATQLVSPDQLVFVNTSLAALTSDRYRAQLPGDLTGVVVEFAEDERPVDWRNHADALAVLRARGARIGVDDVGEGSSDLVRVLAIRPDYVKIAASVVLGCAEQPARLALVESLAGIGHSIGASVVAKGVENAADLRAVAAAGVDLVQGFHIGRPSLPDDRHLDADPESTERTVRTVRVISPARSPEPGWA